MLYLNSLKIQTWLILGGAADGLPGAEEPKAKGKDGAACKRPAAAEGTDPVTIDISDVLLMGEKEKSMTRGAFTTRAFKRAEKRARAAGYSDADTEFIRKKAYKDAAEFFAAHLA